MLTADPLDVLPVREKAPPAVSAVAPAGKEKARPLSSTTGLPTTLGVKVLPTSRSVTEKVPVIAARFWPKAFASSDTGAGSVVSLRTGASFAPANCTVAVVQLSV